MIICQLVGCHCLGYKANKSPGNKERCSEVAINTTWQLLKFCFEQRPRAFGSQWYCLERSYSYFIFLEKGRFGKAVYFFCIKFYCYIKYVFSSSYKSQVFSLHKESFGDRIVKFRLLPDRLMVKKLLQYFTLYINLASILCSLVH